MSNANNNLQQILSFRRLSPTNFTTTRLQWLIYDFIHIYSISLHESLYGSFCHTQAGYCDRFECESIIFNMPGRDRVPLGGGWRTNSVGGLTRDDECIIPKNVYRLPSYRVPSLPVLPSRKWLKPKASTRSEETQIIRKRLLINYTALKSEPDNSDPIVLMQIRDTGCCNFKLFTRKRNDTRTTTVGMLITKADAGRLSTTLHGTHTSGRK